MALDFDQEARKVLDIYFNSQPTYNSRGDPDLPPAYAQFSEFHATHVLVRDYSYQDCLDILMQADARGIIPKCIYMDEATGDTWLEYLRDSVSYVLIDVIRKDPRFVEEDARRQRLAEENYLA